MHLVFFRDFYSFFSLKIQRSGIECAPDSTLFGDFEG